MNDDQARILREIVRGQSVAALGTLHDGEPFVSMVPYARLAGQPDFIIHVSRLAAHTRDMLASARVSLLIMADASQSAQSRARVTVQGDARRLETGSAEYAAARAAYLSRFPDAAHFFELADFSLFAIAPVSARVVGGFAQAFSVGAESLARVLREA